MAEIKAKYKKYDKSKAGVLKSTMERGGVKGKAKDEKKAAPKPAEAKKAPAKKATASGMGKFGKGSAMTIEHKGKKMANVDKSQLDASGLSLRAYMNQWKKTGKRPGKKA